jgi:hypothetical protein
MVRYLFSIIAAFAALNAFADNPTNTSPALAAKDSRFFEMRIYHAAPGKFNALRIRFRDYTNKLFVKHGIETVGCWAPMNKEGQSENTLVYILAFPSREARNKSWKDFSDDLEWLAIKTDSEKDGRLIDKVDSVYMTAADFSPVK